MEQEAQSVVLLWVSEQYRYFEPPSASDITALSVSAEAVMELII
jgi:hypothetical protein